jgi:hypothetical protein
MQDCHHIVEFSYDRKEMHYTARFLDGTTLTLSVADLPQRINTIKHDWADAIISDDKTCLLIPRQNLAIYTEVEPRWFWARGKAADCRISGAGTGRVRVVSVPY